MIVILRRIKLRLLLLKIVNKLFTLDMHTQFTKRVIKYSVEMYKKDFTKMFWCNILTSNGKFNGIK